MGVREPSPKYLIELATGEPVGWANVKLGELASFRTGPFGSALHSSDYVFGGVPVINPTQINGGRIRPTESMSILGAAAQRLSEFRLKRGDIVIGRRGEMGRCAFVEKFQEGWLCGTGSMIIRPRQDLDGRFIQRVLSSNQAVRAMQSASVGTTMNNLNQRTLADLVLRIPVTAEEQSSIADALNDTDALIDSLEQLLTKKRQIKQGAMQELLTGRRRLPGFIADWHQAKFSEVALIDPESLGSETRSDFAFNYIALENVDRGRLISCVEARFETAPSRARRVLRAGDVLVSTVRPNLKSHLLFETDQGKWVASTGFSVVRSKACISSPGFLFALLFSSIVERQIDALLTGSNYPAINGRDVANLTFASPPFEEQVAIAQVLADMDAEINALESRLSKNRALKQAMAQALLTGHIRLAEPAA